MAENVDKNSSLIDAALKTILDNTGDMMFIKDMNLIYHGASRPFAQLVGRDNPLELVGKTDFDIFQDQELAKRYRDDDLNLLEKDEPLLDYIEPIPAVDGNPRYASTSKHIIRDPNGKALGLCGVCRDITREYEAKMSYERELKHLFELPDNALSATLFDITGWRVVDVRTKIDHDHIVSYYHTLDGFIRYVGEAVAEDQEIRDFYNNFSKEVIYGIYESGKRSFELEYLRNLENGVQKWVRSVFYFLTDPVNGHLVLLVILHDIDEEMKTRKKLELAAEQDAMTGLLNRDATMNFIRTFLEGEGNHSAHALFLIDIDNFKQVNDTFGHQIGDVVIKNVASLVKQTFSEADIVGRIGGDEFFALVKNVKKIWQVREKAEELIQNLQHICSVHSTQIELSGSVGISLFSERGKTLEQLYAEADAALYQSKQRGKNQFFIFSEGENIESLLPQTDGKINTVNLHAMLNKLDAGIMVFHAEADEKMARPVFISDSFLAMADGIDREEAERLYHNPLVCVHPDDLEMVMEAYTRAVIQKTTFRQAYRIRGKQEIYFWVSMSANFVINMEGSIDVYAVYTRIDHLMQTEADLREKNRIIELAMGSTDINLWYYDLSSRSCTLLENCKRIHGFEQDVMENFPDCLFEMGYIRSDCFESVKAAYESLHHGEKLAEVDIWCRRPDGSGWWCERSILTTIFDQAGTPIKVIGIGKDITAAKELEERYQTFQNLRRPTQNTMGSCLLNLSAGLCLEGEGFTLEIGKIPMGTAIEYVCGQIPDLEDRKSFASVFSRESLLQQFVKGMNTVSLEHRYCGEGKRPKWLRTVVEMAENPRTRDVEGLMYAVDIDYEKYTTAMMEKLLSTDYELICEIDAATGEFILLEEKQNFAGFRERGKGYHYDTSLRDIIDKLILQEYVEESIRAMCREAIIEELEKMEVYSCIFPTRQTTVTSAGYRQWRFTYLDESKRTILITRTDITEAFASERDLLTGLYTRQAFYTYARQALNNHPDIEYAIVRYDLDRFKTYNDVFGALEGDRLLAHIAKKLRIGGEDGIRVFGRLEADHFVGLMPMEEMNFCEWYHEQLNWLESYSAGMKLTASVGIYVINNRDLDVALMCDRALLALKTVKGSYTSKIAWYDEGLRRQMIEEQNLINDIRGALDNEEFILYFQPQVDYRNGSLNGAEALVRWAHPSRGLLSPDSFVPLFERNGFITKLDEYVWEKTCLHISKWMKELDPIKPPSISVNISRLDFYDAELCDKLQRLVKKYSIPDGALKLEITESAYMENPQHLVATVKRLQSMGFVVELDDFGAGYSSLTTLKDVPVDVLKLDVRFLSQTEDDSRREIILGTIIHMANLLHVPVIAEGVETRDQADYLRSLNCNYMQGYYFGRPMGAEEFKRLIAEKASLL